MSNSVPTTQAMSHATMQMQKQNMELVHNEVKALGKSGLSQEEKSKKLREQCEGFESIFIQKMWQQMRATLPQENPLVGREEKFWQGMYDTELSKEMAKGGGIGLADMMYDQLSQNLVSASRTAAMQSAGAGGIALERGLRFSGAQNAASPSLAATATAPNASPNAKNVDSGFSPEQFMPSPLAGILAEHKQDAKSAPRDLLAPREGVAQGALASSAPHVAGTFVAAGNKAPLYENLDGAAAGATLGTGFSTSGQNIGQSAGNQTHFVNSANNPNALATMTGQGQNSALAQQFLSNLQAKQSANGQHAGQLTGPQRAAQAQYAVGSPPPANGVLPAGQLQQGAHVVRTTYTTNVPAGQRKADKQRLVENAMREAQQKRNKNTTVQGQPSPAQGYSASAGQAGGMTFGVQAGMGQAGVGQVGNIQGQFQVGQPFAPIVPGQPNQPQQPSQPSQPAQPGQPTQPQQPYQPQQPTQAVNPVQVGTHFVAPPAMVPNSGTAQGGTQRKS